MDISKVFDTYIQETNSKINPLISNQLLLTQKHYNFELCSQIPEIDDSFFDEFDFPIFCVQDRYFNFTELNAGVVDLNFYFDNINNSTLSTHSIEDLTIELYFSQYAYDTINTLKPFVGYSKREIDCLEIINKKISNRFDLTFTKIRNTIDNPLLDLKFYTDYYTLDQLLPLVIQDDKHFLNLVMNLPSYEFNLYSNGSSFLFLFGVISGCIFLTLTIMNFIIEKYGIVYQILKVAGETSNIILPKGISEIALKDAEITEKLNCKYK